MVAPVTVRPWRWPLGTRHASAGSFHLPDVLRLCRDCHRLAPFLFYNGNTFAAIIRLLSDRLPFGLVERTRIRQLAGHMVAGTLPLEAEAELLAALE